MARALIGRTVRRLRLEKGLAQQALAARLGISASYLNLIEHDQRAVTATLLIKLTEALQVDLAALSGVRERALETGLREVLSDPLLGLDAVPEEEVAHARRQRAQRRARRAGALPRLARGAGGFRAASRCRPGRRILLPNEEVRDFFHDRANHFAELEAVAEAIGRRDGRGARGDEPRHRRAAAAPRMAWRCAVGPLPGALRRYDPAARRLDLSEALPRESRGFQLAFQLMLLEAREAVEAVVAAAEPSTPEAAR